MLTCLVGRRIGDSSSDPYAHFDLRRLAASLVGLIARKYGKTSQTLKPRLARTCLKHFLDPHKPLGVHFGAIAGLMAVGGAEAVRLLILPNIKAYEAVLQDQTASNGSRTEEAERTVRLLVESLTSLTDDQVGMMNGSSGVGDGDAREQLIDRLGRVVGPEVYDLQRPPVTRAVLAASRSL